MTEYATYMFGKDDFTVSDLSTVPITVTTDKGCASYTIRRKFGMDTPLDEVLVWLEAGANLTVTWKGGKKYKLSLVEVDSD